MFRSAIFATLSTLAILALSTVSAQEAVYRSVTTAKTEALLKEMNIVYTKTADAKREGIYFYDYERNNYKIRLHNYNGKDLWIDALFTDKMSLEDINRWNVRAKFSRAVLIKEANRETVSIESQIDCLGGVTDNIVKQFINRFDGELRDFAKFVNPR